MPRRQCVETSERDGVPVNDETRAADDEPQLGERHKGIWALFDHVRRSLAPLCWLALPVRAPTLT